MQTAEHQTPSNPFAGLSGEMQMILLRADLKTIRSDRGPLRGLTPFIRAHFQNRLIDAKRAQSSR